MCQKRQWILWGTILILIALLLILALKPRTVHVDQFAFDSPQILADAGIHEAYQKLQQDYSLSQVSREDMVYAISVKNLFSACTYYVLPCYILDISNVPAAGSLYWDAALHAIWTCSDEGSLLAKWGSVEIRDFALELTAGENTYIYSYCDVYPGGRLLDPNLVFLSESVDCLADAQIRVRYTVATYSSATERDQQATADFYWTYSLYCNGKCICTFDRLPMSADYIVNT